MKTLADKLKKALESFCRSQGAKARDFHVTIGKNRVGGLYAILVWNGFDSMEVTKRQDLIWTFIRKKLNDEECRAVSVIYARGVQEAMISEAIEVPENASLRWA